MARLANRLPQNAEGEFFVDDSCIDCDACRQIAPATFRDHGEQSSVFSQPQTPSEIRRALMALVSCPTSSIGTASRRSARPGADALPEHIVTDGSADNVYFCGFTSEASFGGWSYLIVRPASEGGNVLVDSPRFAGLLVKRIEKLGGVNLMFLSHRDDIADHAKFAAHFGCPRVMHEGDISSRLSIERILSGEDEVRLDRDLVVIPTPGHTRGHQVLHYSPAPARAGDPGRDQVLFTGDHLSWSPERQTLIAHRYHCWYDWRVQTRSMERLLKYRFGWVLPGHGRIHGAAPEEMHTHLERCVAWMKTV